MSIGKFFFNFPSKIPTRLKETSQENHILQGFQKLVGLIQSKFMPGFKILKFLLLPSLVK
ncbi:hypothetical protein APR40_12025 [Salegentibacter salarius]|uniref:Uncharacterized protein n=1 Tax=Salegentibacter salarius TaxID=435906 RepID=A0A2N0TW95_9FLAO|nr:hypothetical protein BHS39_12050 [Salegentibacter salarius]PKD18928.1 hypothetical protein APR40_12025 [Salegentibacter salarius]